MTENAEAPTQEVIMNRSPEGHRMTVTLIPKAEKRLRHLEARTSMSRTDLVNRAITLYDFVDQLRDGNDLLARNMETGEFQLVQFLDASAGQAPTHAGPAFTRRGPAAPRKRSEQGQRSPARHHRPVNPLPLLLALINQS
jgi:hypothetical protein